MIKSKDIIKNERFPAWFRNTTILNKISGIRKIFPDINLKDYNHSVELAALEAKEAAIVLFSAISRFLEDAGYNASVPDQNHRKNYFDIIYQLRNSSPENYITYGKTLSLVVPYNIYDNLTNKILFKKGMSFFKFYNKLKEMFPLIVKKKLEEFLSFKHFSSVNIPVNLTLHFSSSTEDGLWDILTMSMRGITSCQTWGNASNYQRLIGSVIDPFTGIIYLTNGVMGNYGTNMVRRCLVRYVLNRKTKKHCLLLEKMYPNYDSECAKIFIESLKSRCDYEVIDMTALKTLQGADLPAKATSFSIPLCPEVAVLNKKLRSYCDSNLTYTIQKNDFALNHSNIEKFYIKEFNNSINKSCQKLLKKISVQIKKPSTQPKRATSDAKLHQLLLDEEKNFKKINKELSSSIFNLFVKNKFKKLNIDELNDLVYKFLISKKINKIHSECISSEIVNNFNFDVF